MPSRPNEGGFELRYQLLRRAVAELGWLVARRAVFDAELAAWRATAGEADEVVVTLEQLRTQMDEDVAALMEHIRAKVRDEEQPAE